MKLLSLAFAAFLMSLLAGSAHAVSAPTGLTAGAWANATMPFYWDDDASASSWYIYLDGKVFAKPTRQQASPVGSKLFYLLQPLSPAPSYVLTMRALAVGQPMSAESAALTATGQAVPITYVMTPPGQALSVSGAAGGGGGDASAANQVIGNASLAVIAGAITSTPSVSIGGSFVGVSLKAQDTPLTVSGSVLVSNLNGVTVNPHAVTQGGPWTVSGSVTTIPGAAQAVSVIAGVAGISVTASLASGTNTIGNVGVTNPVQVLPAGGFFGVSVVSDTTTRFYGVTVVADTTTRFYGVTITSGLAGVSVSAQGPVSPTVTVSGNPVLQGLRASTSLPTAVANGAAVHQMADKSGRSAVVLGGGRENKVRNNITLTNGTETTLVAAGSAGVFRDLETLVASNGSTQTVRVDFRDATGGTVRFSVWMAGGGGGFVLPAGTIIPQTTAANNWTAQLSETPAANDIRIMAVAREDN